jgi:MFS family permease
MRFVIGIGESAIISLGYTIINDLSPPAYKTIFMGVILVAAPVGVAIGYGVTGGVLAVTKHWGIIFFVEAVIVTSLAVLCWFVPMHGYDSNEPEPVSITEIVPSTEVSMLSSPSSDVESSTVTTTKKKKEKPPTLLGAIWPLFTNPVYVGIVLYSNLNGAILGALTFWCPSYFLHRLASQDLSVAMQLTLANLGFAVIVLVASIVGTAVGSIIVDKTGGVIGWKGIAKALFISTVFVLLAIPWLYIGFFFESMHWVVLFILCFGGVFFLMATTSPFQVALIA